MNATQRDMLALEMDRMFSEFPEGEAYRRKWDQTLEPFFVKNLENVQGDERDVVFISTVYGRGEGHDKLLQRFGPINGQFGHRRLNVLFTRARFQTKVFSSMDPADIRIDESSSAGVKALKGFLSFARDGRLEQIRHPTKPGVFVLGVECDGATYHSAKSVRDRDRLRQEVLEQLDWKMHRIWSLDWFGNPKRETDRLVTRISELAAIP